jgi:hypothetical protein
MNNFVYSFLHCHVGQCQWLRGTTEPFSKEEMNVKLINKLVVSFFKKKVSD